MIHFKDSDTRNIMYTKFHIKETRINSLIKDHEKYSEKRKILKKFDI